MYYERLAYALESMNKNVSVILPNKISNGARSLDIKTITDKTASQAIVQFGLDRKQDN
jgi:transposase